MHIAGSRSGAYVYDVSTRRPCSRATPPRLRRPASVEKLYTATTALAATRPDGAPDDDRARRGRARRRRRVAGQPLPARRRGPDLRLDRPSSAPTTEARRASAALSPSSSSRDGIKRVTGSVVGDESFLDSLRGEPSSGYAQDPCPGRHPERPGLQPRRSGQQNGAHAPAAYAARKLWSALHDAARRASAKAAAPPRTRGHPAARGVQSPDARRAARADAAALGQLLRRDAPQGPGRPLRRRRHDRAGAQRSCANDRRAARHPPHVSTARGSPHSDRTSPSQVADLLVDAGPGTPIGAILRNDLAVAGAAAPSPTHARHAPPPVAARARPAP